MSDGGFDYNTVFHQMTEQEVDKANIAMEIAKKAARKKGGE